MWAAPAYDILFFMKPLGSSQRPELALVNADIVTLDPRYPKADWVIIGGGRILRVGQKTGLDKNDLPGAEIIDCKGRTVIPGLIDAHLHLRSLAETFVTVNLRPGKNLRSITDIQRTIGETTRDLPRGEWIRGYGYDEFRLSEKRHPTRWELDDAAPNHPVKLTHRTGHAHVLNSLALHLCNITGETPDPPDGMIDRDLTSGEPSGLLYEMGDILSQRIPSVSAEEIERGVSKANDLLLSLGVTTIHDASARNGLTQWDLMQSWKDEKRLLPRVRFFFGKERWQEFFNANLASSMKNTELRPAGVKIILDETTGTLHPNQDELDELVLALHKRGLQAAIHAIEEEAVESATAAIARAIERCPEIESHHRIEHCSVCTPSMARRLARYGITVVTQPSFLYFHGERYLNTVPPRQLENLYPIRTLMEAGVRVAGSSDSPVVPPNPYIGMYAAASRLSREGTKVGQKQRIAVMDALKLYTVNAAHAGIEQHQTGSITPGKLADLVVLSADPLTLPLQEIKDLKPDMTILGGKVVWERNPSR